MAGSGQEDPLRLHTLHLADGFETLFRVLRADDEPGDSRTDGARTQRKDGDNGTH